VFGTTAQEAETTKMLAFNQGFYNLFLALGTIIGLVLILTGGLPQAGFGVALLALSSMVLAAVVLIASNPRLARSALIQGLAPLVGAVLLIAGAAA
jgi:putative membrane protein